MNYPFTLAAPVGSINAGLRTLGATLKAARVHRGNTVRRQAGRAGLSPDAVERIERGACSVSFGEVMALCMSLGVRLGPQTPPTSIEIDADAADDLPGSGLPKDAATGSSHRMV
ncbi:MAG: hypothetical protein K0Q76_2061 [Panacagrimonas sp.]|jgi:transcriptional regulator with XRE-family HTH domain|nr:helix-turn-helix transcriptional regulator [Panacagrimonas sp.]MCC2656953.1 hypothetical protein [Panacagrimonas sp.]